MSEIEKKLNELGIELPEHIKTMANYVPVRRVGNILYLSGSGPLKDGKAVYTGKLGKDLTVEDGYLAARLTIINVLAILKSELGSLDRIEKFVKILGIVASDIDFYQQPQVINGASDLLIDVFGEAGRHARSAIGTSVLPFNVPVEIEVIVEVKE